MLTCHPVLLWKKGEKTTFHIRSAVQFTFRFLRRFWWALVRRWNFLLYLRVCSMQSSLAVVERVMPHLGSERVGRSRGSRWGGPRWCGDGQSGPCWRSWAHCSPPRDHPRGIAWCGPSWEISLRCGEFGRVWSDCPRRGSRRNPRSRPVARSAVSVARVCSWWGTWPGCNNKKLLCYLVNAEKSEQENTGGKQEHRREARTQAGRKEIEFTFWAVTDLQFVFHRRPVVQFQVSVANKAPRLKILIGPTVNFDQSVISESAKDEKWNEKFVMQCEKTCNIVNQAINRTHTRQHNQSISRMITQSKTKSINHSLTRSTAFPYVTPTQCRSTTMSFAIRLHNTWMLGPRRTTIKGNRSARTPDWPPPDSLP